MALEGDLKSVSLPLVLQRLSAQAATGILTVQGADDIVAISLLEGRIVTADSLNQTAESGLGEVLTSRGMVRSEDFAAVVREHASGAGSSLADLLLQKGLLSREKLLESLRHQTYRLMLQVLTWRVGEFKFYGGDEVSFEDGFQPISVEELQIRALEDLGPRSGLPGEVPDGTVAYRQAPGRPVEVKVLGRDGDGTGGGFWVNEKQAAFFDQLDGQLTAAEVGKAMGLDRYQTLFWVYRGLQQGLVERVAATRSAPRPAPAPRPAGAPPSSSSMPAPARAAPPRPIAAAVRPPAQAEPSPHVSQIFVPPDPDLEELGDEVEDEAPEAAPLPLGSLAATFALVLVAAALLALVRQPASYLLPFPWQDHRQSSVQRYLRQSLFQKVDRAAKAYFLMEAHYPDRLDELIELGLLSPSDTRDPAGNSLSYQAEGVRYTIRLVGPDGAPIEGVEETEAITGDFLLDPQFIPAEAANESPLVLLD